MSTPDQIEREIVIDAPIETVWSLISTPGWWLNDGEVIEHETTVDGDLTTVHWKGLDFPIRTVRLAEPITAVYAWESESDPSTMVEFTLTREADGIHVRVVESGFENYPPEQRSDAFEENSQGWETELAAAAAYLRR